MSVTIGYENEGEWQQKYVLLLDGSTDGLEVLSLSFAIYPKDTKVISQSFGSKIKGIVVGARGDDPMACAYITKGGLSQKSVNLVVQAGKNTTEALIKIFVWRLNSGNEMIWVFISLNQKVTFINENKWLVNCFGGCTTILTSVYEHKILVYNVLPN